MKSERKVLEFFHYNKKIHIIKFCSKERRIILAKIGYTVHAFLKFSCRLCKSQQRVFHNKSCALERQETHMVSSKQEEPHLDDFWPLL